MAIDAADGALSGRYASDEPWTIFMKSWELMGPDFASYNFEWLSMSPRWRDHYYATDQTPHYQYMKTVLKILTWQDGR